MTSTTCTSPKFISWNEWDDSFNSSSSDETIILDPSINEFYSTFKASNTESRAPTCASPRLDTSSSEINWEDWVHSFDPYSSDETVIIESNISEPDSNSEVSSTESSSKDIQLEIESSPLLDPTKPDSNFEASNTESSSKDIQLEIESSPLLDPTKPDSNFEASNTESSSKDIQLEIESSPLLNPTDASAIAAHVAHTSDRTCSKQSGEIIREIAYEQEPIVQKKRDQIEDQLRRLQRDLQNGLLTKGEPAKEDIMDKMSCCLSVLESLQLPAISISATRIPKLLRAILRLKEIPKDDELRFKERTQTLLDSLNTILEAEDLVKKSNLQPEGSQHLLMDMTGPDAIPLTEKVQPASLLGEKMVEDRIKAPSSQPPSSQPPSSQPLVIDLTGSDDESETPSQIHIHELNVGVKKSKTRKRKHFDTSILSPGAKVSPRQSKRVKRVQDYLPQENIWISTALKWIENIVKEGDGDTIQVKRTDLLGLKDELEFWRTEDLNVTCELELLE